MSDRRLIEDYLPITVISAEASREKSIRKGHISTLHLWWARRPLVASRAAVYGRWCRPRALCRRTVPTTESRVSDAPTSHWQTLSMGARGHLGG